VKAPGPTFRLAVLLVVLAATGVSACGSSSGDQTGSSLTAREYRARANAVCSEAARRLAALERPRSFADVQPYLKRSVSVLRPAAARLSALRAPEALSERAAHAASIVSGEVFLLRRISARVRRGADPRDASRPLSQQIPYMTRRAKADWHRIRARSCERRLTAGMARALTVLRAAPLPPAKAKFLAAANAICARNSAVERALVPKLRSAPRAVQIEAVRELLASTEQTMADLRSLRPPAHDRARVRRIFARTERALRTVRAGFDALVSGDRLGAANYVFARLPQIAAASRGYAAYGMTECAR
jgi:hypothetical protein